MEVFLFAIVLVAALVIGTEDKQSGDHANHSSVPPTSKIQSVDREHSAQVCDRDQRHITQRDLTVPLDQQVSDSER